MPKTVAVAYIPVLHKGYFNFLQQLEKEGVSELWLVGDEILGLHKELDYINRKDRLRAVPLDVMRTALEAITKLIVHELTLESASTIEATTIITPREDIGEVIVEHYFKEKTIDYRNIFLRRNFNNINDQKPPEGDTPVTLDAFMKTIWNSVLSESQKSADWWRQVGAALVKDGEILFITHNEHMPEEQLPNIEGDARSLFKKGVHINYVTAAHAEVAAIGEAARRGISTAGSELYVTDFPCPYCARLIAKAGIKKVYYRGGYAVLDGDVFLKEAGVELVPIILARE